MKVQHAPICAPTQSQNKYALGRLEEVRVRCDVLADPPQDLVFTWYFNGSQPQNGDQHHLPNGLLEFTQPQPGKDIRFYQIYLVHASLICVFNIQTNLQSYFDHKTRFSALFAQILLFISSKLLELCKA